VKLLITIGLLILAVNMLVVIMVGFVLASDWYRGRRRRHLPEESENTGEQTR
jgi:cytochrome c oxidase assembly factor CtaG